MSIGVQRLIGGLISIGACHFCSTHQRDSRLFCDDTCKQYFIEDAEMQETDTEKESEDVVTEHKT